jgi:hypothetical protein
MKFVKDSVIVYASVKVGKKATHPQDKPWVNPFAGMTEDWSTLIAKFKADLNDMKEKVSK